MWAPPSPVVRYCMAGPVWISHLAGSPGIGLPGAGWVVDGAPGVPGLMMMQITQTLPLPGGVATVPAPWPEPVVGLPGGSGQTGHSPGLPVVTPPCSPAPVVPVLVVPCPVPVPVPEALMTQITHLPGLPGSGSTVLASVPG